jgi:hypothetical protein
MEDFLKVDAVYFFKMLVPINPKDQSMDVP